MKIRVYTIDVRIPRWLKRVVVFGAIPAGVLLGAVHYLRADVTLPHSFSNNDILSAQQMNDNLDALKTGINSLAARVTTLEGTIPSGTVPPGTVVAFAGETVPSGWLLCDGSAVSRTAYAGLFAAVGIAHGGGNGTTTFNVPDYRGRFLRGVNGSADNDPDASARAAPQAGATTVTGGPGNAGNLVGSVQRWSTGLPVTGLATDTQGDHIHPITGYAYGATGTYGGGFPGGYPYTLNQITEASAGAHTHQISGGDPETRPANAYVNYVIKY